MQVLLVVVPVETAPADPADVEGRCPHAAA
jgi:hypothetical protein